MTTHMDNGANSSTWNPEEDGPEEEDESKAVEIEMPVVQPEPEAEERDEYDSKQLEAFSRAGKVPAREHPEMKSATDEFLAGIMAHKTPEHILRLADDPNPPEPLVTTTPNRTDLKYQYKVHLVLVDSDKYNDWGVVEDDTGNFAYVPGKSEIIGTWSRTGYDDMIHITLTTSINALLDRATQTWAAYALERKARDAAPKKPRAKKVISGETTQEAEQPVVDNVQKQIENTLAFNSLRARLGK